uniref:Uncharacterized protein n=1 Tax=Siphoviridae sp. ctsxw88 TaxID=2825701 RepID=A0A8S5PGG8_9CAUD|nr:MAG TPA: hypothetical protein [Siphoviridae sp. ctsxw88]
MTNRNLDWLDIIAIISFVIGLANYEENVDQSTMNNAIKQAVKDIHSHLEEQDNKINEILELIKNDSK